ncbi:hypothetical protein GGF37_000962 [Kickxella alabastrina]|nr:hypothetical protein GGF37_000962 [Kickxella alabastrina]
MAMRAALFNPKATTTEIKTSLQHADSRRRVVSEQTVPIVQSLSDPFQQQQQEQLGGRLSHDGIIGDMSTTQPIQSQQGAYMRESMYSHPKDNSSAHPASNMLGLTGNDVFAWNQHSQPPSTAPPLDSIPQSPRISGPYKDMSSKGMRRNLFNGFRKVANAVKTAAASTSWVDGGRRESIDQGQFLPQSPMRPRRETSANIAQYPQISNPQISNPHIINPHANLGGVGEWMGQNMGNANPTGFRQNLSVLTADDHGRPVPIAQLGPRQRSLTQQHDAPGPLSRAFSDITGQVSRSIDLPRDQQPSTISGGGVSSGGGGGRTPVLFANSIDSSSSYNRRPSNSPLAVVYEQQPMGSASSLASRLRRKSPAMSNASISSGHSSGSIGHQKSAGLMHRSYELGYIGARKGTSLATVPVSVAQSAHSSDAVFSSMVAAQQQQQQQLQKTSQSFKFFRRDRSMTLPTDSEGPAQNLHSHQSRPQQQQEKHLPNNPAPLSSLPAVPRMRSHSDLPVSPVTGSTEQFVPSCPEAGQKLILPISESPLFSPMQIDFEETQNAGERIHKEAIHNMSMAEISASHRPVIPDVSLPSPAIATTVNANANALADVSLGTTPPVKFDSPAFRTPDILVDSQYLSIMMNTDKLQKYLKQVSDVEQARELNIVIQAMKDREEHSKGNATGNSGADRERSRGRVDDALGSADQEMVTVNDSGIQVNGSRHGLSGMVVAARSDNISGRTSSSTSSVGSVHQHYQRRQQHCVRPKYVSDADMTTSILSGSHSSLSTSAVAVAAGISPIGDNMGSLPSGFSFSHSRYSLINQDGSLNLASFQFDQLEGYQKELTESMGSMESSSSPPPQRSESRIASRLARKNTDTTSGGSSGWFWGSGGSLASMVTADTREHQYQQQHRGSNSSSVLPKSPRLPFGSASISDSIDCFVTPPLPSGSPAHLAEIKQNKLMRLTRKQQQQLSGDLLSAGMLPPVFGTTTLDVFAFTGGSDAHHGVGGGMRNSESSHDGSEYTRRPSLHGMTSSPPRPTSMFPINRRPSDNLSIDSNMSRSRQNLQHSQQQQRQHHYQQQQRPLLDTLLFQQSKSPHHLQRLMPLHNESPYDLVYRNSVASMSLEQALTLVEGTTSENSHHSVPTSTPHTHSSSVSGAASGAAALLLQSRYRRLHKRSASALSANELDDIMIMTAEMCHSVQSAIKVQRASESGLGRWIRGVVQGDQQQHQDQDQQPQQQQHYEEEDDGSMVVEPLAEPTEVVATETVYYGEEVDSRNQSMSSLSSDVSGAEEPSIASAVADSTGSAIIGTEEDMNVSDVAAVTASASACTQPGDVTSGMAVADNNDASVSGSSDSSLEIWKSKPKAYCDNDELDADGASGTGGGSASSQDSIVVVDPVAVNTKSGQSSQRATRN